MDMTERAYGYLDRDDARLLREWVVYAILVCFPLVGGFVQVLAGPRGQETVVVFRPVATKPLVVLREGQRLSKEALRLYVSGANVGPSLRVDSGHGARTEVAGIPVAATPMVIVSRPLFNMSPFASAVDSKPIVEVLPLTALAAFVALQPGVPSMPPEVDAPSGVAVPGPPTNLRIAGPK